MANQKIIVSAEQHATIMAALRFYQERGMGDPYNRHDALQDLATNNDQVTSLDDEGINELCEHLNMGGEAA